MKDRTGDIRIDYLKFLFETDHDLFQQQQHSTWLSVLTTLDISPDNRRVHNLTVLPRKAGERSRYIIEIWGEQADEALRYIPMVWFNHLRRVDWRYTLNDVSADDFEAATRYLMMQPHKINRSIFNTKPRQKRGDSRDVGGIGIYYGSRRSARHGVVYKRGKELPAYEFRAQDKLALAVGRKIVAVMQLDPFMTGFRATHEIVGGLALDFAQEALGANLNAEMGYAVAKGRELAQATAQLGLFDETEEEHEWWSGLSPEEQLQWQRGVTEPTPKGWQDAPGRPALPAPTGDTNQHMIPPGDMDIPF